MTNLLQLNIGKCAHCISLIPDGGSLPSGAGGCGQTTADGWSGYGSGGVYGGGGGYSSGTGGYYDPSASADHNSLILPTGKYTTCATNIKCWLSIYQALRSLTRIISFWTCFLESTV